VAQRHRQHRIRVLLDDAERRRGELRDRRRAADLHLERKRRCVGERATGEVAQRRGHLDAEGRVLRQRLRKRDLADVARLVVLVEHRREGLACGGPEAHLRGELARDRRGEAHRQRADRQAGRRCALALAGEVGGERGAHHVAEALLDARHDLRVVRCRDPLAPDEAHRGAVGQRSLAARDQRAAGNGRRDAARLQHLRAHVAADDDEREPLADALDLAPRVGRDARLDRGTAQAEQEVLVLFDLAAARAVPRRSPAAGREREARRSGDGGAALALPGAEAPGLAPAGIQSLRNVAVHVVPGPSGSLKS
jgi:hypothetical protein